MFNFRSIQAGNEFANKNRELCQQSPAPKPLSAAFCSATLTALNKNKTGIRPIAVSEVIRRLVAKCIAKEAAIEAVELFQAKQLGGAESIMHTKKITFEKNEENKKLGHTPN